jgi:predicted oxidoreductase
VGVSNHSPSQVSALIRSCTRAGVALSTTQPELSLLHHGPIDDGDLDQAIELGLQPLAWSPIGGGRLAVPDAGDDPAIAPVVGVLDRIAEREGVDRTAVALAWVLAHPSRPVAIIGTQRVERITAATDALTVRLSRLDWYDLIAAAGHPLP